MAISWLLNTNLQNKTLCLLCTNLQKDIVSNSGWKLSPIINKRGGGGGGGGLRGGILTRISLSTNFQLKLTIAIFWTKFAEKGSYFQPKTEKIDTTIEFCIFQLVFVSNFTLNKQFWIFGPNLPKKDMAKNRKTDYHHWIPLIQISLGTKFQLKLTI